MADANTMWTVVAAGAAGVSALFAAAYTLLTHRLVRSQTEPHVVVYVSHDDSRASILIIVVENVGRGLASDVTFASSRPIPGSAFGIEEATAPEVEPMSEGPLIDGIPTLGPGDARRITWGQYGGLKEALGEEPIVVTCNFKHGRRKMPSTVSQLEIRSFAGTDATSSEGARTIKELEKLRSEVKNVASAIQQK